MTAFEIAFRAYLPILIAGFVAILTCLFADRRNWSRWPCAIGLALTRPLLLLLAGIPIALEFLSLLALARRLGLLRRKSPRYANGPQAELRTSSN